MAKQIRAYKRSARKRQVIKQLQVWKENGFATEATSYKLAGALDMRPSQTFRDILNEMVDEGQLARTFREDIPGRMPTFFYSLVDGAYYHELFSRRHIAVRSRGVAVGQLEMFS